MRRLFLAAVCLSISACSDATEVDPETDAPTQQWSTGGKADIYGSDDRHNLDASAVGPVYRSAAGATAVLIGRGGVTDITDTSYGLNPRTLAEKQRSVLGGPLCSDERFRNEPAPGFWSAFLIAPDLVATAGHCVNVKRACGEFGIAFGFNTLDGDPTRIDQRDYRQCAAVVGHLYDKEMLRSLQNLVDNVGYSDWAIMKLDEPVTHRVPLTIRGTRVQDGERIAAIGHPSGVPTKVTYGRVVQDEPRERWFNTDLDIYGGNSGSVIVDGEGRAVGIAARGTGGRSFEYDEARACYASDRCSEVDAESGDCYGNQGVHIDKLNRFLRAVPSIDHWMGGFDQDIPNDGRQAFLVPFDIEDSGAVEYVTINTRLWHDQISELKFTLVAPDGTRHVVMDRPTAWNTNAQMRPSRTSFDFAGISAEGRWTLQILDTEPSATAYQHVEWAQLVVGVRNGAVIDPVSPDPEPEIRPTWVGSPCSTDADCTFQHLGTPGQCYTDGGEGFCTLPCEGYCPDREGFATTFCAAADFGGGACHATPASSNGYCDDVPTTSHTVRDRYVGSSNASAASREVCAP